MNDFAFRGQGGSSSQKLTKSNAAREKGCLHDLVMGEGDCLKVMLRGVFIVKSSEVGFHANVPIL